MDKFDHLIAARSGFKGKDLVEFNKGTRKAQAKGSLYGLEGASMVVPVPMISGAKAIKLVYHGARRWKMLRHSDLIGKAAAAESRRANPIKHKVVSIIGHTAKNLGRLQDKALRAGDDVFRMTRSPSRGPRDLSNRATQMFSEAADRVVSTPSPKWMGPGAKGVIGSNISERVIKPARRVLRDFAEFHNTKMGQGSLYQMMGDIMGEPINTTGWKRTRKVLGKMDDAYKFASGRGASASSLNIGLSAPVLIGRLGILRHSIDSGPLGQMNRKRKNGSK